MSQVTQTTEVSSTRKRPSMASSSIVVTHTPVGSNRVSFGGFGQTTRRTNVSNTFSAPLRPQGDAAKASKEVVTTVLQGRGKEKQQITELNTRFASYIESVKFLECQVKLLTDEIEKVRKMKGYNQDRVREEYEEELQEARRSLESIRKELSPLQARELALQDKLDTKDDEINALRKQREELQAQINKLSQMCGDLEGECATLRLQCETSNKENDMLKQDVERLRHDNDRIRFDYEAAVTKQINAESDRDAIAEELQFVQDSTNAEIEELRSLLQNMKSTMPDIKADFQNSFKSAVQALQKDFQDQVLRITEVQQKRYEEQIMHLQNTRRDAPDSGIVKTENRELKSTIDDQRRKFADIERDNANLRAELNALRKRMDEDNEENEREKDELRIRISELIDEIEDVNRCMDEVRDSKLSLEMEIATYRKLLDQQESSIRKIVDGSGNIQSSGGAALSQIIAGGGSSSTQQSTPENSKPVFKPASAKKQPAKKPPNAMSESTGTVRVTRSSKCIVTIAEAAQDGSCVRLENSSQSKDFELGGWTLERSHPKGKSSFQFPKGFKLGKGKSVKIFGDVFFDDMSSDKEDLRGDQKLCKSWGVGNGSFTLSDESGNDKAVSTIKYN